MKQKILEIKNKNNLKSLAEYDIEFDFRQIDVGSDDGWVLIRETVQLAACRGMQGSIYEYFESSGRIIRNLVELDRRYEEEIISYSEGGLNQWWYVDVEYEEYRGDLKRKEEFPAVAKAIDLPASSFKVRVRLDGEWQEKYYMGPSEAFWPSSWWAPTRKWEEKVLLKPAEEIPQGFDERNLQDILQALAFASTQQLKEDRDRFLAWLGKGRDREITIMVHGRKGAVSEVDIQKNIIYLSWRAVRAPPELSITYAKDLVLSLKIKLYHELRHLIYPEQSEAVNQQYTIEKLKNNMEILKAHLRIINSGEGNSIVAHANWLNLLSFIGKVQKLTQVIPVNNADIFLSIQPGLNARLCFDHKTKKAYQDKKIIPAEEFFAQFQAIDTHIDSLKEAIWAHDYLTIPYGNLYCNAHFVVFKEGIIYHQDGEFNLLTGRAIEDRVYTCFVAWKNGRKSIEKLIFVKGVQGKKDVIKLYKSRLDITEKVNLAIYGQQLVEEGDIAPLNQLADQFADFNQLQRRYQHSFIGLTKEGDIICGALAGERSENKGATVEEMAEFIRSQGAVNAILLANGGDVNIRHNDDLIVETPAGSEKSYVRTKFSAVLVIAIANTNLSKEIRDLSLQQREAGFVDEGILGAIRQKRTGIFELTYNLARARTQMAKRIKVPEGACRLCAEFMPEIEKGIPWRNYTIYMNPSPVYPEHHFVLANKSHVEQSIDISIISDMIDFVSEAPEFRIIYNGKGAGASIPQHQHFQGFAREMPIESVETNQLMAIDDVIISEPVNYPASAIIVESKDKFQLSKVIDKIRALLNNKDIAFNILFTYKDEGMFRVFVYPRGKETPGNYFSNTFGTPELSGSLTLTTAEDIAKVDLDKISEKEARNIIKDVLKDASIERSEFQFILKELRNSYLATPFYLSAEHGRAYSYWEQARLEGKLTDGAILVHIDAHNDLRYPNKIQNRPNTIEEAKKVSYDIVDFIVPAVAWGLVDEIYMVVPEFQEVSYRRSEDGEEIVVFNGREERRAKVHYLRTCELPDFSNETRPVILDIDEDYFIVSILDTEGWPSTAMTVLNNEPKRIGFGSFDAESVEPEIVREELRKNIKSLISNLLDKKLKPAIVTVAISAPVYTPLQYADFITEALRAELRAERIFLKDDVVMKAGIFDSLSGNTASSDAPVNINFSLGGTKLGVGVVNSQGEIIASVEDINWEQRLGKIAKQAKAEDIIEGFIHQIGRLITAKGIDIGRVQDINIAFAGPVDSQSGIVGTPFAAPNLPFDNYPLSEVLEAIMADKYGKSISVAVINDTEAAAYGELSPRGALAEYGNGMAMIIGTGINAIGIKAGKPYKGEDGEIQEIGHNLVSSDILPQRYPHSSGAYTYTGMITKGDHPKVDDGSNLIGDIEDKLSGPNLDKYFNQVSNGRFTLRNITDKARAEDEEAARLIQEAGNEYGRAIAALIFAYKDEGFIEHFVLVSGVSENLGKGVADGQGRDLFIGVIQDGAREELMHLGMEEQRAEQVSKGIVRSSMTYERELLAKLPVSPNAAEYPATMPTNKDLDRIPTDEELNTIITAFGGKDILAARGISLDINNVVISPALGAPAEVKGGILYVNPNTLRGPPEQLKVIFEGHELFHLLYPEKSEEEIISRTINYLITNNLLSAHIHFLQNNNLGLEADKDYRETLEVFSRLSGKVSIKSVDDIKPRLGVRPLVVAINRAVFGIEAENGGVTITSATGGAAPAIYNALKDAGGGIVFATANTEIEKTLAKSKLVVSRNEEDNIWVRYIFVPEELYYQFYDQVANPILWLIQHTMAHKLVDLPQTAGSLTEEIPCSELIFTKDILQAYENGYKGINQIFAIEIMEAIGGAIGTRYIIQDYHFYFITQFMRQLGCQSVSEIFIHIPWPAPNYFEQVVPSEIAKELLGAMLENNIIEFHIPWYTKWFMMTCQKVLGASIDLGKGIVTYNGKETLVLDNPISIDVAAIKDTLREKESLEYIQRLKKKTADKILIFRADRIDLSKGIIEGYQALRELLRSHPELKDKLQVLAMVQLSRLDIKQYKRLLEDMEKIVSEINQEFSPEAGWNGLAKTKEELNNYLDREWPLIVVLMGSRHRHEIGGARASADIGLVNSLTDGMNLVLPEIGVCNDPLIIESINADLKREFGAEAVQISPAVIVASKTMGIYQVLEDKRAVIGVNPNSIKDISRGLMQAISEIRPDITGDIIYMTSKERAALLSEEINKNTISDWANRLIKHLGFANHNDFPSRLQLNNSKILLLPAPKDNNDDPSEIKNIPPPYIRDVGDVSWELCQEKTGHPERWIDLKMKARSLSNALDGRQPEVWHINSSGAGGGVADILKSLMPISKILGVNMTWFVIGGTSRFFNITKSFHNAFQGDNYVRFADDDFDYYKKILDKNAKNLLKLKSEKHLPDPDIIVIHDPQPAGLIEHLKPVFPKAKFVWRIHIQPDISEDEAYPSRKVWNFLKPYVELYDAGVNHQERPIFEEAKLRFYQILPSINPLGIISIDLPHDFLRVTCEKYNIPQNRPIVIQNARFDPWKDPEGVMEAWSRAVEDLVQEGTELIRIPRLILSGPLAGDDPQALDILKSVEARKQEMLNRLSRLTKKYPQRAEELSVLSKDDSIIILPLLTSKPNESDIEKLRVMDIPTNTAGLSDKQKDILKRMGYDPESLRTDNINDLEVNVLCNVALIAVLKSIKEGFGLAVSGAAHHIAYLIVSGVGGIVPQVIDVKKDPVNATACVVGIDAETGEFNRELSIEQTAEYIVKIIKGEIDENMPKRARQHVIDNFLPDRHLLDWYNLFSDLMLSKEGDEVIILPPASSDDSNSNENDAYPLPVPEKAQKQAEQRFSRDITLTNIEVEDLTIPMLAAFRENHYDVLKQRLEQLKQLAPRAPPKFRLIITTDLTFTQGNVAACSINSATVYIHPYFFELAEAKQLEIMYHELISHIVNQEPVEQKAMKDTWNLLINNQSLLERVIIADISIIKQALPRYYNIDSLDILVQLRNEKFKLRKEYVHIVDEQDNQVGITDRAVAEALGLIHRTTNAFVITPEGKLLLQRRGKSDKTFFLCVSIFGGHMGTEVDYAEGIKNELEEELHFSGRPQGKLLEVANEFYDEEGDSNKEHRKLFMYWLTPEEYKEIMSFEEALKHNREHKSIDEFNKWLIKESGNKKGFGEVWKYCELDFEEICNAPIQIPPAIMKDLSAYDKNFPEGIHYLKPGKDYFNQDARGVFINRLFQNDPGAQLTTKLIEKAYFTPDLLERIIRNEKITNRIRTELIDVLKNKLLQALRNNKMPLYLAENRVFPVLDNILNNRLDWFESAIELGVELAH
ncbi:ROK family protein, partial [Candidatus Omnitrophota bacterium]